MSKYITTTKTGWIL